MRAVVVAEDVWTGVADEGVVSPSELVVARARQKRLERGFERDRVFARRHDRAEITSRRKVGCENRNGESKSETQCSSGCAHETPLRFRTGKESNPIYSFRNALAASFFERSIFSS